MVLGSSSSSKLEIQLESSGAGEVESAMSSTAGSVKQLGTVVAGAGAVMAGAGVAGFAKSASAAASFDQSMQNSIAVMGDVDDAMRNKLEKTAREVATTTTHSHEDAAESFYYLASAGLDAAESIEAMPKVAALAEAGNMNMAEATDVATNTMSAFGIEAENIEDVTDVMTETVASHNQTMDDMGDAFTNAAPAAAAAGISIEELSAAIGLMGDVGIAGAEAGTAVNSIIRRFAKRSGEAGAALDELGIKTTDAQGNLLPLHEIIAQLEEANLSTADAARIFGDQQSAGMALVNQGSEALKESTTNLENAEGATAQMAKTQKETLNAQLALTKSQINDVAISIGQVLLPHLTEMLSYFQSGLKVFADWNDRLGGMPAVIILLTTVIGGLATMLGGVLISVGGLSGALAILSGAISTGIAALGAFAAAFSAVLIPLGLLAAAIYAFHTNMFGFRDITMEVVRVLKEELMATFQMLQPVVQTVMTALTNAWNTFIAIVRPILEELIVAIGTRLVAGIRFLGEATRSVLTLVGTLWNQHGETVMMVFQRITEIIQTALTFILETLIRPTLQTLLEIWRTHGQSLFTEVSATWDAIRGYITGFIEWATPYIMTALEAINMLWQQHGERIKLFVTGLFEAIQLVVTTAFNAILTTVRTIMALVRGDWEQAWTLISDFLTTTFENIMSFVSEWGPRFQEWLNAFVTTVQENWQAWLDTLLQALKDAAGLIIDAVTLLGNTIIDIVNELITVVQENWRAWFETLKTVTTNLGNAILGLVRDLGSMIGDAIDALIEYVSNNWQAWWDSLKTITTNLGNTILGLVKDLANLISSAIDVLIETVSNNWRDWWDSLKTMATNIGNAILGIIRNLKDLAVGVFNDMFNTVQENWRGWLEGLKQTIINVGNAIIGIAGDLVDQIAGKFTDFDWKGIGTDMMNAIKDGITEAGKKVVDAGENVMSNLRDKFPGSDAKEGPMSDLTDTGPALVHTFAGGIESNINVIDRVSNKLAQHARPDPTVDIGDTARQSARGSKTVVNADITVYAEDGEDAGEQIRKELYSTDGSR